MPITELIFLTLHPSPSIQHTFTSSVWPTLCSIVDGKHGQRLRTVGSVLTSNGEAISSFKPALGLEWDSLEDFKAVATSEEFANFIGPFGSLVADRSTSGPRLYDTDGSPREVFGAGLTEVFEIAIGEDPPKEKKVREAWEKFVSGVGKEVVSLSGISVLRKEERTFLGMVG